MDSVILAGFAGLGSIGLVLALGLVFANKKLYVADDPLLATVKELLPSTNCGGCGYPGCGQFAEGLVAGDVTVAKCAVLDDEGKHELSCVLGKSFETTERMLARIMCQGGLNEAKLKGVYTGAKSCAASQYVSGGHKLCEYGCIGFGDCAISCPFDAIFMNANELPEIIDAKCTGCGICVDTCPKDIIELHPESRNLLLLCKSLDINKDAKKACSKSCTACGLCTPDNGGAISIVENIAVIDFGREGLITKQPECPRNCFSEIKNKIEEIPESAEAAQEEQCIA